MEYTARKITKALYGDNYDNPQYERVLTFLHDLEKLGESSLGGLFDILTNLIEPHKQE